MPTANSRNSGSLRLARPREERVAAVGLLVVLAEHVGVVSRSISLDEVRLGGTPAWSKSTGASTQESVASVGREADGTGSIAMEEGFAGAPLFGPNETFSVRQFQTLSIPFLIGCMG